MPKQRITRDMVIDEAFRLAKQGGMEAVLVKNIAQGLDCSVQPIYSYCSNMDELRATVELRTNQYLDDYVHSRIDPDDLFRSIGQAHIQFAKEQPHLFKIFILQARSGIASLNDLIGPESGVDLYIARQLGISTAMARQLHLNMLIFTVGLGTIYTSASPGIPLEEILNQQGTAYEAFLAQAHKGEHSHC